jgi:hypothetical protein
MLGKPQFKVGERVMFECVKDESKRVGVVYIVDKYGTFDDPSDVSYDIMVDEENMLYKHISERYVTKFC